MERWLEQNPGTFHLHADASDDDPLRKAGVPTAAGVFAVTGDDSHNLMVSLSVKLQNPPDAQLVRAGAALVLMTSPEGRADVERLLRA